MTGRPVVSEWARWRRQLFGGRRKLLLATLVDIAHEVGASLDPTEVLRGVYGKTREILDIDAFYVATISEADSDMLRFRYRVEGQSEVPGDELPKAGSLAGACIDRGVPLLLRDAERDRTRLQLPPRRAWGTVIERSIMVAPLRLRGRIVGAISAQSIHPNAYDESDLEVLVAIANEAAIAIDRADLYDRATGLSRRLFDLHRVGIELAGSRDLPALLRRLVESAVEVLGSRSGAIYLDHGGDSFEQAIVIGPASGGGYKSLRKDQPLMARAARGERIEVADTAELPDDTRRQAEGAGHRSFVMQPMRSADEVIGVLFATWLVPHELSDDDRAIVDLLAGIAATAIRGLRLYGELDEAYLATVQTLMATIQIRDGYRDDHLRRVAADAVALGERLALPEEKLRDLRYGALFHSLGKIAVPATILSKPSPLTPEEQGLVREHPLLGARILESIRFLRGVVPIVRHANERWDGSGYPDGLAFEATPYEARILHIAISYQAMVSDRPYRRGLDPEIALSELRLLAGTRYDPGLVDEFVSMIGSRGGVEAVEREVGAGTREMAILAEITPEFSTLLDLDQLLDRVLAILLRHMPENSVTIMLRDEASDDLVVRAVAGRSGEALRGLRFAPGHGVASWVLEHRQAQVIEDVRNDPRYVLVDASVRAMIALPFINEDRSIGVLSVFSPHVGAFSQRDLTLMQAVGAQIAAAIEVAELHERLKRAANTDALTGLHNYRYFYDRLEEEIPRAARRAAPLAVAFFDIDHLKRVNDTHGHLAGNEVLRTLGRVIGANVRIEDVPARYGGDEFAILMPDTPRDEAERVVARLMELLDRTEIRVDDEHVIPMPTRSWGISAYPIDGRGARELIDNADTRAYARKRAKT